MELSGDASKRTTEIQESAEPDYRSFIILADNFRPGAFVFQQLYFKCK